MPLPPCSGSFEYTSEGGVSGFTGGETEKPFQTPGIRCVVGRRFNAVNGEQEGLQVIFPILCSLVHSSALGDLWILVKSGLLISASAQACDSLVSTTQC